MNSDPSPTIPDDIKILAEMHRILRPLYDEAAVNARCIELAGWIPETTEYRYSVTIAASLGARPTFIYAGLSRLRALVIMEALSPQIVEGQQLRLTQERLS